MKKESRACNEIFARLLPLYPLQLNILAVDMTGRIFGSAVSPLQATSLAKSDMEWFARGSRGVSHVTGLHRSKYFSQPFFMITMPVFSNLSEQTALLGLPVNLYELQHKLIDTEGFDANAVLTVIDNSSNILLATMDEGLIGQKLHQQKILLQLQPVDAGSFQAENDKNAKFYYSFATVEATGWKVLMGVPVADVSLVAKKAALNHIFIFLLLGGATALFSFIYSSALSRKIELLVNGFKSISEGKLDCRLVIPGSDEFSQAATAFNEMADARQKAEAHALMLTTTLEKRVELRTAELLAATNELESFSYAVSHDLQAPVRHVLAYSQILLDEHAAELPESARHFLTRINRSGENMRNLITHLLSLAKLGRQQVKVVTVDLGALGEKILLELTETEPERSVAIRIENGLQVCGDCSLLEIAMKNLIDNAWKYTRNEAAPLIEIGRAEPGGTEAFFVKDNGCGFDMSQAERLFAPFQRLHTAEQFEGSGIGLATVARIIHKHGGSIWAESQPGNGAVFYFTLQAYSR
jgi:signal transduction histidine kinase